MGEGDHELSDFDGLIERHGAVGVVVVFDPGEDDAAIVENGDSLHAERHPVLGMALDHGFHRVVEVGVESEDDAGNCLRLVPLESQRGIGVCGIGDPGVGLKNGAFPAIDKIIGLVDGEWRVERDGQVVPAGATLGYPELEGVDTERGVGGLAGFFGDAFVGRVGECEDAGETSVGALDRDRGIGSEADEKVLGLGVGDVEFDPNGLRRRWWGFGQVEGEGLKRDVGRKVALAVAGSQLDGEPSRFGGRYLHGEAGNFSLGTRKHKGARGVEWEVGAVGREAVPYEFAADR